MPKKEPNQIVVSSPQAQYEALQYVSAEAPCPYLVGRLSRSEAYYVDTLSPQAHERLMGYGFRRSGRIVYRPRCRGCKKCVPLRVPVAGFSRTRSMRRVWARNADLRVEPGEFTATKEKYALFQRYLDAQHDDTMTRTCETFQGFLYDSPTDSAEFRYMLGERLIGVSIVDRCPGGLSSVYMYFDPDCRTRSLGTFSILWEIEYCRRHELPYYYLGYYVAGSKTMDYKARFRPNEVLSVGPPEAGWVSFRA